MSESGWSKIRTFINQQEIGSTFTSDELMAFARCNDINEDTANIHCNVLRQTGFLKNIRRGVYQYVTKISNTLSIPQVQMLKNGRTLDYLESIVANRENTIAKAERDTTLAQHIKVNTKLLQERMSHPCIYCKNESLPIVVKVLAYKQPPAYVRNVDNLLLGNIDRFAQDLSNRDVVCYNCCAILLHAGKYCTYKRKEYK